jgi:GntR family transcriptional regulator
VKGDLNVNPLSFSIDFRSGIPVYVQIVEQVQSHLTKGNLSPGDQLPTVRELAAELRVNFNTVARAYRMLDEAGLISTQQGRGTYILDQPDDEQMSLLKNKSLEAQIERLFTSLKDQGFTPEEVEHRFRESLGSWKTGKPLEDNEKDN